MPDAKVMEKIRAILRKAGEGNPSQEEREVAMAMANKMLMKHGLTLADVGDLDDETIPGREFGQESTFTTEGDLEHWRGLLLRKIAKVYFCDVYRVPYGDRKRNGWVVYGRADYVRMTQTMYSFVEPQIERELNVALSKMTQCHRYARRYAETIVEEIFAAAGAVDTSKYEIGGDDSQLARLGKEHFEALRKEAGPAIALMDIMERTGLAKSYSEEVRAFIRREDIAPSFTEHVGVWRRSWVDGAVARISARLRSMMREEVESHGTSGNALVRNERDALQRYYEEHLKDNLTSNYSERNYDPSGARAGDAAGKRADLSGHSKVGKITRKELGS